MTKPTKWHLRPAKTQISLGIRPVLSESSLSAWRKLANGSLATHLADAHTDPPSLICLHWAHSHFVDFVSRWLILLCYSIWAIMYFIILLWLENQQKTLYWQWQLIAQNRTFVTIRTELKPKIQIRIEPHHEKTCLCHMRTTKAQISPRIHAVWSAPLLFAACTV